MNNPDHPSFQCRALFAKLSDYIDNDVDPDTRRKIEAHLAACPPCRVCLCTLQRTVELCRQLQISPPPAGLAERLRNYIPYRD